MTTGTEHSTDDARPMDLIAYVKRANEARRAYPRARRPLMRQQQRDAGRSKRPWVGERSNAIVEKREQERDQKRQQKRNHQAAGGEQFRPEPTTTFIGGTPRAAIKPYNGGTKFQHLAALRLTHTPSDSGIRDAADELLGADSYFPTVGPDGVLHQPRSIDEAQEILADLCGPRPTGPRHSGGRDMSSSLVNRDVGQIADKLERDPRIRFKLIKWAQQNIVGSFPGPNEWYSCLCVKHNLHYVTGEPLHPWKGKFECARRLREAGAAWADEGEVAATFRKYQYYLRFGSQAISVAKWRTLHEEDHRRQVWVPDQDDGEQDQDYYALERPDKEVLEALEAKFIRDRGL